MGEYTTRDKYKAQPDVDMETVIADAAIINYGVVDNINDAALAEHLLSRQQEQIWEETNIIEIAFHNVGNRVIALVKGKSEFEDFLLKYTQHESEEEATVLSPQDDDEILYGVWFDAEIDNS
jgi:hypothetical protein